MVLSKIEPSLLGAGFWGKARCAAARTFGNPIRFDTPGSRFPAHQFSAPIIILYRPAPLAPVFPGLFDFRSRWNDNLLVRLGLFVPCFVDGFYPKVGVATVQLLEHLGFHPEYPPEQTCCGQPHFNAGKLEEARELAEQFCRIFEPYDVIVCPSGSCTAMVRCHYPDMVKNSDVPKRVFELCEFLVDRVGVTALGAKLEGRAALHIGCHARREIDVTRAVESLLQSVEGLTVVETPSDAWCCGFGGTFSVKYPEISTAMGKRRLAPVLDADVDYLISTDSSCLMHLGGMLSREGRQRPKLLHVAEVLATALEAS